MDSRSFIVGLICGAIVGALTVWLLRSDGGEEFSPAVAAADSGSTGMPDAVPVTPAVEQESLALSVDGSPVGSDTHASVEPPADPRTPWPDDSRAEFASEPKDLSWAHYMEQTLLQYLSTHPSIAQFDISGIECRTTRCRIEVRGFDESTRPVWQQVMYDIRQQPWSEFSHYGTSSGYVEDRFTITGTLWRGSEPE